MIRTIAIAALYTLATSAALPAEEKAAMKLSTADFGVAPDGQAIRQFTLANGRGVTVKVISYGGIITSIHTPDRTGKPGEITLGFDRLEDYLKGHPCFGALCGRVANRIANARFTLDGQEYLLAANNGVHHLHGGVQGFDKRVWKAATFEGEAAVGVVLEYLSPDGEEGYPGNLAVKTTYTLAADGDLRIDYWATTDKKTPLNLTNHAYFNLENAGQGDVLGHILTLNCSQYLPVDDGSIPLGKPAAVIDTPMDFTRPRAIGERIERVSAAMPGGYDHCFVIDPQSVKEQPDPNEPLLRLAATVQAPVSGRVMHVYTSEPGVQLYTGNFLDGTLTARGAKIGKRHGFCLETQHFPDSINQPQFPSVVLEPGQTFHSATVHKFSTVARK